MYRKGNHLKLRWPRLNSFHKHEGLLAIYNPYVVPQNYVQNIPRKANVAKIDAAQVVARSRRVYTPETFVLKEFQQVREAHYRIEKDFNWKKMQDKDYSVADQLNKTPIQIFMFTLLYTFENIKRDLIRILSEVYVQAIIISGEMAYMVGQVFKAYRYPFMVINCHLKRNHITRLCMSCCSIRRECLIPSVD